MLSQSLRTHVKPEFSHGDGSHISVKSLRPLNGKCHGSTVAGSSCSKISPYCDWSTTNLSMEPEKRSQKAGALNLGRLTGSMCICRGACAKKKKKRIAGKDTLTMQPQNVGSLTNPQHDWLCGFHVNQPKAGCPNRFPFWGL